MACMQKNWRGRGPPDPVTWRWWGGCLMAAASALTRDEILLFKTEGFLVKRGLIPQACVHRALERVWAADSKPPTLVRGKPETYCTEAARQHGWAARDIGAQMLDFLPGEPRQSEVWAIAEQLLGSDLIMPDPTLPARPTQSGGARAVGRRTRGVYNTLPGLPESERHSKDHGCHQEGHPFQLGVVGYVAPVPVDGGGFHVWPRSHRMLWRKVLKEYSSPGDGKGSTDTAAELRAMSYAQTMEIVRLQEPFEFVGGPGGAKTLALAPTPTFHPRIGLQLCLSYAAVCVQMCCSGTTGSATRRARTSPQTFGCPACETPPPICTWHFPCV